MAKEKELTVEEKISNLRTQQMNAHNLSLKLQGIIEYLEAGVKEEQESSKDSKAK
tara:strand:- start:193 stop:357 length:165 start_codon:yes stop_codon:yes gene_type:complete